MASASLYDIAPRLALARDQRRWEVDALGDFGPPGEDIMRIEYADHSTEKCRCGGTADRHFIRKRILKGMNKGVLTFASGTSCRKCGFGNWRCGPA